MTKPIRYLVRQVVIILANLISFKKFSTVIVNFEKFEMALNVFQYTEFMISRGSYEKSVIDFLRSEINEGENFVDVGANVGYITLTMCSLCGTGSVFAFEPFPQSRAKLQRNLNLNGFTNCIVRPEALSSHKGEACLNVNAYNTGGNSVCSISQSNSPARNRNLVIATCALDEIFDKTVISGVKIDVEGHETEVLKGMSLTLEARPLASS